MTMPTSTPPSPTLSTTSSLTRILTRLSPKILSTDPHSPLRHSVFERTKTAGNLTYARTLLLRAEHEARNPTTSTTKTSTSSTTTIKTGSKQPPPSHQHQQQYQQQRTTKHDKQAQAAELVLLAKHRALIKKLNDRLFELGQVDTNNRWIELQVGGVEGVESVDEVLRGVLEDSSDNDDDDDDDDDDGKGVLDAAPALKNTEDQRRDLFADSSSSSRRDGEFVSSGVRARGGQRGATTTTTTTANPASAVAGKQDTGVSTSYLLNAKNKGDRTSTTTATTKNTSLLESADTLHADLTSSLVGLATQLKLSAQAFSDDLADDAQQVSNTEEALSKNKSGLDAATQRMGLLRRMSEGRWWWGRMVLYAGIGVLWVVLVLVVFVGPKLRF